MKRITLSVPGMYADHHTLRVREVLSGLEGIISIDASSGGKRVTVVCEDTVSPQEIGAALEKAGYPPNRTPEMPQHLKHTEDGSSWYLLIERVTETEAKDLAMSGDFRRY